MKYDTPLSHIIENIKKFEPFETLVQGTLRFLSSIDLMRVYYKIQELISTYGPKEYIKSSGALREIRKLKRLTLEIENIFFKKNALAVS